jgi:cell division protein ZapA
MTAKKTSLKLSILGEDFTVRTDEAPEHTRAVGEHVDRTIRSVGASDPRKAAIMAALTIADELFKERATRDEFAARLRELSAEVRRMLPPGKR